MSFSKQFENKSGALTLSANDIGTHKDGWTVIGFILQDHCSWVNDFSASHELYGRVWGDFEQTIFADSEEGLNDFVKNHPPKGWNYRDIPNQVADSTNPH